MSLVIVFTWNIERARGLRPTTKLAAEFRASTNFHHADTHFLKNLFAFAFTNRRVFLVRSTYWVRFFFPRLPSGMLTWEPCGRRPLLNWRKYNARTKTKTIAGASTQNLGASKQTPLYGFTCRYCFYRREVFISLEIFLRVPQKKLRASQIGRASCRERV